MTRPIALAALAVSLCAAAATIFLTTIERSRLLERAPRAIAALDPILPPAPSLRLELVGGYFEIHDADGAVASIPVLIDQGMFGSRAVLIDAPEGQRLVVAAPMAHDTGAYAGSLWWFDHETILPAPGATDPVAIDPALASRILDGPAPDAFFGAGLAATQDLNADGVGDLLVGAPGEGAAFVLSGADGAILRTLEGDRAEAFGIAAALATDFPRDGVREHAVASMFLDPAGNTRARRWTFDGATGALLAVDATADAPIIRLAGDLDGNGAVTDEDLARVLLNFGLIAPGGEATPLFEDINQDTVVDEQDVEAVLLNFGETSEDFGGDVAVGEAYQPCTDIVYILSHPGLCDRDIPTTDGTGADGDLGGGGDGGDPNGGGGGGGGDGGGEGGTTSGGGTGGGGTCSTIDGPGPGPYSIVDRGAFYVFRTNRLVEDCSPEWNVSSGAPAYYDNTITAIINAFEEIGVQTVSSGCNCTASYYVYEAQLELDAPSFANPVEGEPPSHLLLVNDDDDDADGIVDLDDVDLASDDDFAQLTVGPIYGGGGGGAFVTGSVRWTLTGKGVRLWYRVDTAPFDFHANAESPGTPVVRTIGGATYREFPDAVITRALGGPTTILVEAVAPSATVGDARIRYALTGKAGYGPMNPDLIYDYAIENELRVTGINIDLDIDSDNDDGFGAPERSGAEDGLEEAEPTRDAPGKLLLANTGDIDGDEVPDYADGLLSLQDGEQFASQPFAPLVLDMRYAGADPVSIRFTYSQSPPSEMAIVPNGIGSPFYALPAGNLRIWTKSAESRRDPRDVREGGDFIPSGAAIELDAFAATFPQTLYIEAVRPSQALGDLTIQVDLSIGDLVVSDKVACTALPRVVLAKSEGEQVSLLGLRLRPTYTDGTDAIGEALAGVLSPDETILVTGADGPHPEGGSSEAKDLERIKLVFPVGEDNVVDFGDAPILILTDDTPYDGLSGFLTPQAAGDDPQPLQADNGDWTDPNPGSLDPDGFEARFEEYLEETYGEGAADPSIDWLEQEAFELRGLFYAGRNFEWFSARPVWRDGARIFVEDSLSPERAADEYYAYLVRNFGPGTQNNLTAWTRYVGELNDETGLNRAAIGEVLGKHWGLVDQLGADLAAEAYVLPAGMLLGVVLDLRKARKVATVELPQGQIPLHKRNFLRGKIVEHDAIETSLGRTRYAGANLSGEVNGAVVHFKPDALTGQSLLEVKDWIRLSAVRQIRAEAEWAARNGRRYVLMCTTRTTKVYEPVHILIKSQDAMLLRRNVNTAMYQRFQYNPNYVKGDPDSPPIGDWVDITKTEVLMLLDGQ